MKGNNAQAFQDYQTPKDFFRAIDAEFHFTLDAAASADNTLCPNFCTKKDCGLETPWEGYTVWCNPPYGRWELYKWIEKAARERRKGVTSVLLVPASTETEWFHRWCWDETTQKARTGVEVRFIKGRLRFVDPRPKPHSYKGWRPLMSHMLLIFRGKRA